MVLAADRTAETLDLSCAVLVEDYTRYSASLADNVAAVVAVVLLRTAVVVVAERCSLSRDTADTSSHQHHQHSLAVAVFVDTLVASLFAALGLGICCFLAIYLLPSPLEERIENSVVVVVKVVDHPSPTEDIAAARAAAEDTTRKTKPAVAAAAALLLETQYSSKSTTMLVEEASHRNGLSEVPADARVKENYYFANSSPSEAQKRDTRLLRMIPVEAQEPERYIVVADTLRCASVVPVGDTDETKD